VPVLAVGLLAARTFEQRSISEARENLHARAQHLAALVARLVADASLTVREMAARQVSPEVFLDADRMTHALDEGYRSSGVFVTLLAAGEDGMVFARAPRDFPPGETSVQRIPVSDREYFSMPMATGKPYVSGVFRGRGFGTDLLIAVSAPAVTDQGRRLGVVEGSIRVGRLEELIRANAAGSVWRYVLADGRRRVITAPGAQEEPLSSLAGTALGRQLERAGSGPVRFTAEVDGELESFLSVTVPVPGLDWTLTVQRPWQEVLRPVLNGYGWMLLVAMATVIFASYFATWSLRDLLRAWQNLTEFSHAPTQRADLLQSSRRLDLPLELQDLMTNLAAMAHRLETEQRQREELLAELESRVKERTRELERALVLAQAADRAKSAFLATVSHELRTPLTSIITGLRLLKVGPVAHGDLASRTLATMEKSGQILMSVISDVLDYSRLEAGGVVVEEREFRPAEVVADVAAIVEPAARKAGLHLATECRHAPDLSWIGDAPRVKQVLLNLAGNAVKFTSSGNVQLTAWVGEDAAGKGRVLWFSVRDTGYGIPADRLEAVFEPFVQLESNRVSSQAGTGLGLSISRRLVAMMGGAIEVESQVGAGSEFRFWIPNKGNGGAGTTQDSYPR
jgi:signal transduction histidine kinase